MKGLSVSFPPRSPVSFTWALIDESARSEQKLCYRFNDYTHRHTDRYTPQKDTMCYFSEFLSGHDFLFDQVELSVPRFSADLFPWFSLLGVHVKHIYLYFNDVCNDGAKYFPHY